MQSDVKVTRGKDCGDGYVKGYGVRELAFNAFKVSGLESTIKICVLKSELDSKFS